MAIGKSYAVTQGSRTARRPNVLWLCTDQQRYDTIAALGNGHIATPNLDRLVRGGTAFTRAYCQSPICTPSRASFMSGLYASTVHVNYNGNDRFPEDVPVVSRLFADAGYRCGLAGKLHLASAEHQVEKRADDGYSFWRYSHSPHWGVTDGNDYARWVADQGEDLAALLNDSRGFPSRVHHSTWCTEMALEFLAGQGAEPWFLTVNYFYPHPPFNPPREYRGRYDPDAMPAPLFREADLEQQATLGEVSFQRGARHPSALDIGTRKGMPPGYLGGRQDAGAAKAHYYALITHLDEQIGRLLGHLAQSGQLDDTIVLFMSDHGEMLGDHGLLYKGCRFYDGLVRIPLIWSWPGRIRRDQRSPALAELTDIAPTLLDLAGLPIPGHLQGRSLAHILGGNPDPARLRRFVRSEYFNAQQDPRTGADQMATMYRDERYKLVVYHGRGLGELYDLQEDPGEFHNLWSSSAHAALRHDLMARSFDATVMAQDWGSPRVAAH